MGKSGGNAPASLRGRFPVWCATGAKAFNGLQKINRSPTTHRTAAGGDKTRLCRPRDAPTEPISLAGYRVITSAELLARMAALMDSEQGGRGNRFAVTSTVRKLG